MRRLAARRAGGLPDREPGPRRPSVAMLAAGLVAVLLLVLAAVVWWPRDRAAAPAGSVSASRAARPLTDPAVLQQQLDGVVEAGAPGVVGLVRAGGRTWQGAGGLGANRPARPDDRFRIGSVTKRITVRQLLNHTSGLYNYSDDLPEPPAGSGPRSWSPSPPATSRCSALGGSSPTATPTTSWPACWWSGSPASHSPTSSSGASSSLWAWTTPSCRPPSGHLPARMSGAMRHPTRIGR